MGRRPQCGWCVTTSHRQYSAVLCADVDYAAQKNMRSMKEGELAFFYHSNCKIPGIAGVMRIVQENSVDESAFDSNHPYHDPKSKREAPRWFVVHVSFVKKFANLLPLRELQKYAGVGQPLHYLQTLRLGRLSVSKVNKSEWDFVLDKAGVDDKAL